jgi:hypothetical protein
MRYKCYDIERGYHLKNKETRVLVLCMYSVPTVLPFVPQPGAYCQQGGKEMLWPSPWKGPGKALSNFMVSPGTLPSGLCGQRELRRPLLVPAIAILPGWRGQEISLGSSCHPILKHALVLEGLKETRVAPVATLLLNAVLLRWQRGSLVPVSGLHTTVKIGCECHRWDALVPITIFPHEGSGSRPLGHH